MKLTEENADYMDCRPDFGKTPINMDLIPDYLKERMAKVAAARAAAAQRAGDGEAIPAAPSPHNLG